MIRKHKTNFYAVARRNNPNQCRIILKFSYEGDRLEYYVGHSVEKSFWDKEEQRVIKGYKDKNGTSSTDINKHLYKVENTIEDIYAEYKALKKKFRKNELKDELKNRLDDKIPETSDLSLLDYFEIFIETNKSEWKKATKQKKENVKRIITDFHKKHKIPLEFDVIDSNYFKKLIQYSVSKLKHQNSNISKNLSIYKGFLNWAYDEGYNKSNEYRKFSIENHFKGVLKPSETIALTKLELIKLYNHKFEDADLELTRDIFCFACFTGLRFSDLKNLKKVNIKENHLKIFAIKGNKEITVDLNKYSKAILKKYFDLPMEHCFPVPSNAELNAKLKGMGQELEFNDKEEVIFFKGKERISEIKNRHQLITTHTARRTFISNALVMNIPAQVIMKWTGHSDYKSFERYVKISEQERKIAMSKFDSWE
jgi:integrase